MKSSIIVPYEAPHYCSIDPSHFGPRLLPGETVQGLLTVFRIPPPVSDFPARLGLKAGATARYFWASGSQ